jgi:SAM-dependent methyltransferase
MPELMPDQIPDGWNRSSQGYDRDIWDLMRPFVRDALDLAQPAPDARVLDVAAGSGAVTLEAARRAREVLAVDFADQTNVETRVMDGQALALEDASYDLALSNFGLIFFPDRIRGFSEMHRVLRPGGRAVVTAWRRFEILDTFLRAVRAALKDAPKPTAPPPMLSLADRDRFAAEMRAGGFTEVSIHTVMHSFTVESAEALWEIMSKSAPPVIALLDRIGPEGARRVRDTLLRQLGDGEVVFRNEAHIGVAVRAAEPVLSLAG